MKRYVYRLFAILSVAALMASCAEKEGTEPGNDSRPGITVYQYKVSRPFNVDNDVALRFAANSRTAEAYCLAEKTADRESRIDSIGEEAYREYVISNGFRIRGISGASNADTTLTGLSGEYTITAVAVSGGAKASAVTVFKGLDWTDVATGTYRFFNSDKIGISSSHTTLQVCTADDKLYRFRDVFGTGYHMKINLLSLKGSDADGEYTFFRVPVTDTPFVYEGNAVSVRDIGYWQGSDAWVTDNGYESGMHANYSCFIYIQYFATGSSNYGYDFFIPE
jgi:hypothetical protein